MTLNVNILTSSLITALRRESKKTRAYPDNSEDWEMLKNTQSRAVSVSCTIIKENIYLIKRTWLGRLKTRQWHNICNDNYVVIYCLILVR